MVAHCHLPITENIFYQKKFIFIVPDDTAYPSEPKNAGIHFIDLPNKNNIKHKIM